MPASHRLAIPVLFAFACHAAPTSDPSAPPERDLRPEVAPVASEPAEVAPVASEPAEPDDELLAERQAIADRLASIAAEIEPLQQSRTSLQAYERELRTSAPRTDDILESTLAALDQVNERISTLRDEESELRKQAIGVEQAIERRREGECNYECRNPPQFQVRR